LRSNTVEIIIPQTNEFIYAFDQGNLNWHPRLEYNLMFMRCNLSYFHDMLATRGHLFLNEVLDELGIPRTMEGALMGWMHDKDKQPQIFEVLLNLCSDTTVPVRITVDGVIFDKI
jgi:hypothetical protein